MARVVLDLATQRVSHLVVMEIQSPHTGHLVPLSKIERIDQDRVYLKLPKYEIDTLPAIPLRQAHNEAASGLLHRTKETNTRPEIEQIMILVAHLTDPDAEIRQKARRLLVKMGEPAVPYLIQALTKPNKQTRWQAAKALSKIGSATAAPALVEALKDDGFGIRWLAGEGLIEIGRDALPALLHALIQYSDSIRLRAGAHHVLCKLEKEGLYAQLEPVVQALEDVEPAVMVPLAAHTALLRLKQAL
jgi:HEAT repeat protein